ncbi:hypothetical protein L596_005171 [Steinernema carpocapsae]|uniref:Protein MON2 homolog n=1 Tax=Steinernema carpocapsae TaxID=34508 RepID=A0A4U8UY56_STECR|nr:hypothetical protein L596_005171 [Steinernema carpocapsae]
MVLGGASEAKKLVEYLLGDLRLLSTEAKKKQNSVKEAAESCLVKIRNISTSSTADTLLQNLRSACSELLQPLILGCSSKNARLVQISLQAIQRMLQYRIVDATSAPVIVNEIWQLMEAECEELRVLQTVTLFVTTELLVCGSCLAKCIVLALRLNFAKDPAVINAASAAVRQIFGCVFERIVQEDGMKPDDMNVVNAGLQKGNQRAPPQTLRPCAADGYLLFRDLCYLLKGDPLIFLIGIKDVKRTLALELVESVVKQYPSIFYKHPEFSELLKEHVCPLIIKLFSPNLKFIQTSSQHPHANSTSRATVNAVSNYIGSNMPVSPDRPFFPIAMRLLRIIVVLLTNYYQLLVTECEIFLTLLLKFLESDKLLWQRAIALEVLHRIVSQAELLAWFCENYDMNHSSAKVVQNVMSGLTSFVQVCFLRTEAAGLVANDEEVCDQAVQQTGQPGFLYKKTWIPYCMADETKFLKKNVLLDALEKHEPGILPEGYCLSLTFKCITEFTNTIEAHILKQMRTQPERLEISKVLFESSWGSCLVAVNMFIESSVDDKLTETVLNSLFRMTTLASLLDNTGGRDALINSICQATLPPSYVVRVLGSSVSANLSLNDNGADGRGPEQEVTSSQSQIIAVGTTCPVPGISAALLGTTVMLTVKNMEVGKMLIKVSNQNGTRLRDCWHIVLSTLQHFVWILGMKPDKNGEFKTGGDVLASATDGSASSAPTAPTFLTEAVRPTVSELSKSLNELFEATSNYDDVGLHHVIAALCKQSSESMMVSQNGVREPSFFGVAKLLQTGLANLERLEILWKPVTAHLIEICGHSHTALREWGAIALTTLIKNAMMLKKSEEFKIRQKIVLAPLKSLCEVQYSDVRRKQLECLMFVLQSNGQQLSPGLWITVIEIVGALVDKEMTFDENLVKQGYETLSLIITDFLESLPLECVQLLVETSAKFGAQQVELNISLSALQQLWTVSDFVRRKTHNLPISESETMWLVLYNCLSELCVDGRPPVRKSACQTLLQTVSAHGSALSTQTWRHVMWKVLFPMLDKVRALKRNAPTEKTAGQSLGATNILIHHSRDTESKQWAETSVQTLTGIVKIFVAQKVKLSQSEDYQQIFEAILGYIECSAVSDSSEMSLAALKSFYEILTDKPYTACDYKASTSSFHSNGECAYLPAPLWQSAWKVWVNTARSFITPKPEAWQNSNPVGKESNGTSSKSDAMNSLKFAVPSTAHLTTIMIVYVPLFKKMASLVNPEELRITGALSLFRGIVTLPIVPDQVGYMPTMQSDINSTQLAVLKCVSVMFDEMSKSSSPLRCRLPDLLKLLMDFSLLCVRSPFAPAFSMQEHAEKQYVAPHLIPFAETSMRTLTEYYSSVASLPEVVREATLVDVVKCFGEILALKYQCMSQSSWQLAVSSFITTSKYGVPLAREHAKFFVNLWPNFANAVDKFLHTTSRLNVPLTDSSEMKRFECMDCEIIELIKVEILPYLHMLPTDFVNKLIEILNKGSVSTLESVDSSGIYQHRAVLSRACFEALLSISQVKNVDTIQNTSINASRINSHKLPARSLQTGSFPCKEIKRIFEIFVLDSYKSDRNSTGHMRLPEERVAEVVAVFNAISTLIAGLTSQQRSDQSQIEIVSEIVHIYPTLVSMIPCAQNDEVAQALMYALNSFQSIMITNFQQRN